MPFYRFTVPSGGATLAHKQEVAAAVTKVHSEVTGAPGHYVHCSFTEVAPDSIFVAGEPDAGARMVGLVREGRSNGVKAKLLHGIADAWSEITGDRKEDLAIFLHEVPGANVLEDDEILPEAADDTGAVTS